MKSFLKLFISNLKLMMRDKQMLFWSMMFPLLFTFIFGFFFGKGSSSTGTVALINQSDTKIAKELVKSFDKANIFKIQKEKSVDEAKDLMKQNDITAIVVIPKDFGKLTPKASKQIRLIYDPANVQSSEVVKSFLDEFLTKINYKIQRAKPIFQVKQEKTNRKKVNYFDFVLVGLLGMALMNSSVQRMSIRLTKYREDKILKRLLTTPLKIYKFIASEVISQLILNIFQISLVLTIGVFVFGANIYGNIFYLYLMALTGAILFQLIGFTIASFAKTNQAAEGMSVAIVIPMMFLAGVFFPIDQLPKWLSSIVQYLPLAPLLRMMRTIALEAASPFQILKDPIIVFSWILFLLIVSSITFKMSDE